MLGVSYLLGDVAGGRRLGKMGGRMHLPKLAGQGPRGFGPVSGLVNLFLVAGWNCFPRGSSRDSDFLQSIAVTAIGEWQFLSHASKSDDRASKLACSGPTRPSEGKLAPVSGLSCQRSAANVLNCSGLWRYGCGLTGPLKVFGFLLALL